MNMKRHRLIIVSNRLPVVVNKNISGSLEVKPGSGGLVTALAPVLRNRGGVWLGWSGLTTENPRKIGNLLSSLDDRIGYSLESVTLDENEIENYYKGFSNETLWPLFHDLIDHCKFKPEYWKTYQSVNMKFAQSLKKIIKKDDFIWIHDYHLISMIRFLRELGVNNKIGFFLHIPFPPTDIYTRLPWRVDILGDLLQYDLVGFQSARDRRNFTSSVRTLIDKPKIEGKGQVINIVRKTRTMRAGVFPISIDYKEFDDSASSKPVTHKVVTKEKYFEEQKVILGVDRLDYTKGIPERLEAFREALRRYPVLLGKLSLIQILVPSRRDIPHYENLKIKIERLVSEINGEFSHSGWTPIEYHFRAVSRDALLSYYRIAEIAIVTPLKDGMNLVAKEYCASNPEGILILSEFAGAAAQLKSGALLVNPHDSVACAEAIQRAVHMPESERKVRMKKLRKNVHRYDIYWWVENFLDAAFASKLSEFSLIADYTPLAEG
ncbi:MAG: trehalose-6-phosphate synthase [Candidatus Marinimicrobia bacterium]|nr:trehalose-6-phosphate synthase [Candidatus Neomarinimicrobiota bacterium]